jgi:hypothetical protein
LRQVSPSNDALSPAAGAHTLDGSIRVTATADRGLAIMSGAPQDATTHFVESMQRLLVAGASADEDIVMPECLERSKLDFSIDSLHIIDQYLNDVHDNEHTVVGLSLLTTIWAAALYVGEIIRRAAPARGFDWVTIGDEIASGGGTTTNQVDIGAVRALRARDGEMCMPSRAVLRVILRGRKARSVHSFARGAIESANAEPEPVRKLDLRHGSSLAQKPPSPAGLAAGGAR